LSYNASLAKLIATATSMRASLVGDFDARRRRDSKALFIVTDKEMLSRIGSFLIVDERSLEGNPGSWMTPGELQLNFLQGHRLIVSVVLIFREFLRWSDGGSDARLVDPSGLTTCLVGCGWQMEPNSP
jgi:hypothetical protein